jgi:hypothetical protein
LDTSPQSTCSILAWHSYPSFSFMIFLWDSVNGIHWVHMSNFQEE